MITLFSRRSYHLLYLFREFRVIFSEKASANPRKYLNFQRVVVSSGNDRISLHEVYLLFGEESICQIYFWNATALSKLLHYQNSYIKTIIPKISLSKEIQNYP